MQANTKLMVEVGGRREERGGRRDEAGERQASGRIPVSEKDTSEGKGGSPKWKCARGPRAHGPSGPGPLGPVGPLGPWAHMALFKYI